MIRARLSRLVPAWIAALLLATGVPPPAHAQEEAAVARRATELREAPGDTGRSLAALPADTVLTRTGERQGPWVRVRTAAGAQGWVHLFDIGPPGGGAAGAASGVGGTAASALRGVASFFTKPAEQRAATPTSTIGIRGLGAEDLAQAQPDAAAVTRMEALRTTEAAARQFAREAALAAVTVEALPAPPRAPQAGQQP